MRFRLASLVLAAAFAAACTPTIEERPWHGGGQANLPPEVRDALASRAANLIVANGQPLPPGRASFDHAGDDEGDLLLHSSLSTRDEVRVRFAAAEDVPDRAALWLQKVRQSGGEVVTCDVSTGSAFGGVFAAWIAETLAGMAMNAVRDYALYRPAGDRHAILEKEASTGRYRAMRFVRRDGEALSRARAEYRQCRP